MEFFYYIIPQYGQIQQNTMQISLYSIYKDDGLVVFNGKKRVKEIKNWSEEFQKTVNRSAGNQHLQFNAEICTPKVNHSLPVEKERVQTVENVKFPFLDIYLRWSPEGYFQFVVFRKKGQQLTYIKKETHQHTQYPTHDPFWSPEPNFQDHLKKTVHSFWGGRQYLPQQRELTPQGRPRTS